MQKSDSIKNIAKALVMFHLKVDTIKKDSSNPFFKSTYASLSNILEAINIPLQESGLTFAQFPTNGNSLTTILMHADSGEFLQDTYHIHPVPEFAKEKDRDGNVLWRSPDSHVSPQSLGSAITYGRRYALSAILGLNIDEDDDGNQASGKPTQPAEKKANELPWLNKDTKQFAAAVDKIKAGQTDIAKIKQVMRVSKEVESLLNQAVNN